MAQADVIDGKAFSEKLVQMVAVEAKTIEAAIGRAPALAVVLVGEDPASAVYVRNKIERTTTAGMRSIEHCLPTTTDQATLLALITEMNADDTIVMANDQSMLSGISNSHATKRFLNNKSQIVDNFEFFPTRPPYVAHKPPD